MYRRDIIHRMNKKLLVVTGISIVIIGGVWYMRTRFNTDTPATPVLIEPVNATTTTIQIEIKKLEYKKGPNEAVLEYPFFAKQPVRSVLAELNLELEREAHEMFNKNTAELESNLAELKKYGMDLEGREFVHERTLDADKIYTNASTSIASIVFSNYVDFGGAHGSFFYNSIAYDTVSGSVLTLKDLLTGDYEKFLNTYITEQIKQKKPTCKNCENLGGEIDPVEGKIISDSFVLSHDGITFLYGAYDLGSYVETSAGQEIFVPKTVLAEFIQRQW